MDKDKVIDEIVNSKYYYTILPTIEQKETKYFMPSRLRLEDDPMQLFDSVSIWNDETEVTFVEQHNNMV